MEPHGKGTRGAMKAGLLAAGLLLGFGPGAAWGCDLMTPQGPVAVSSTINGLLVETIERVSWTVTDEGEIHRLANAKEVGALSQACGSLAQLTGRIKVQPALSDVPVTGEGDPVSGIPDLGVGTVSGDVKFYRDSGSVLKGTMAGFLDFTPTNAGTRMCPNPATGELGPCPFVYSWGTWVIPSVGLQGGFSGLALVAFPCAAETGYCYLDVTGALSGTPYSLVPLTIEETQPAPSAKFVITLYK
jgi:hypothetical protein